MLLEATSTKRVSNLLSSGKCNVEDMQNYRIGEIAKALASFRTFVLSTTFIPLMFHFVLNLFVCFSL